MHRRPLRLHRLRRHPGQPQPLQAGPHVRAGAALPAALDPVRRGWRRSSGRHRQGGRGGSRHLHLHAVLEAQRTRADGRRDLGAVLRRQHRAARVLRRDHRHRELDGRDGRAGHDRGRRPGHLHPRRGRPDVVPGAERRHRHPGQGRGRRRPRREAVPLLLPGPDRRMGGPGPAQDAPHHPGEPRPHVRHARGDRDARRRRLGARDPQGVRRRHHHRARARRGQADGADRQQPAPPRRRHRQRRGRQGRTFPAALRRLRPADHQPHGLSRHDGRPGGGGDRAGAPLCAHVQHRRESLRANVWRHRPQGLRPGRPGDVRRQLARPLLQRRLAHRRVRRHEHRGRREARLP